MEKIRIGIVGTGYTVGQARAHVKGYKACSDDCKITAVYDIVPGRAAKWAEENEIADAKICTSYEELLDSCDALSLVTPNYSHIDMAVKALEKGKHILCEKPFGTTHEECMKALEHAKCTDVVSQIGFSYRGISAVKYMRKMIQEGKLGKIFHWRETLGGCRIANPDVKLEWRMQEDLSGSGALADFGCHMLDLCDWTLAGTAGKMKYGQGFVTTSIPEREILFRGGMGKVTNDDTATFNVKFEDGALASFVASRLGVRRHTIEVYGEGGMMLFRDDRPNELEVWFKDKTGGYTGQAEVVQVPEDMVVMPWFNDEIIEFIDHIKNHTYPERDFQRAYDVQCVLDKIIESTKTGMTVEL